MTEDLPDHKSPERGKILQLYAAFGAGLALSVVPLFSAATLSFLLVFGVLIAAYIIRGGAAAGSLTENHMTYIIRTIWIGTSLSMVTVTAGSIYLFKVLDNTPLDPCIAHMQDMAMLSQPPDPVILMRTFMGCFASYITANFFEFLIAGIICAGPVLLYFAVRYFRGLFRAMRGYRLANPLSWF